MGYWKGDKTNWELDRGKRRRVFDLLKGKASYSSLPKEKTQEDSLPTEKHQWTSKKSSTFLNILGALIKIAIFLFIFYAAAMFISHGKHWP